MACFHSGGAVAEVVSVHRPLHDGLSVFSEAGADIDSPRPYGHSGLDLILFIQDEDLFLTVIAIFSSSVITTKDPSST